MDNTRSRAKQEGLRPHDFLCKQAVVWLLRRGFQMVCDEVPYRHGIADAIGIGFVDQRPRCCLVEAKFSRDDFRGDFKKYHRKMNTRVPGVTEKYYFAPKEVIPVDEVPDGWGLVEWDYEDNTCRVVKKVSIQYIDDKKKGSWRKAAGVSAENSKGWSSIWVSVADQLRNRYLFGAIKVKYVRDRYEYVGEKEFLRQHFFKEGK